MRSGTIFDAFLSISLKIKDIIKALTIGSIFYLLMRPIIFIVWAAKNSKSSDSHNLQLDQINKILVTRFQSMGDMIVFIPALRTLRGGFPQAHISVLAVEKTGIEVLEQCPYIDEIIAKDSGQSFLKWLKFLKRLRGRKFDLFISSAGEDNLARVGFYIGAKYIVGFKKRIRCLEEHEETCKFLQTVSLEYNENKHEVEQNVAIPHAIGIEANDAKLEFWTTDAEDEYVKDLLWNKLKISRRKILIGIHPGSKRLSRCWLPERFAKLADLLTKKFNAYILIIGSCEEMKLAQEIANQMEYEVVILNGKTTIVQLASLMRYLSLFICTDSGPLHLAAAMGTPIVALFGPGEVQKWYPYSKNSVVVRKEVDCSPCGKYRCEDHRCMKLIEVDDVLQAADRLL